MISSKIRPLYDSEREKAWSAARDKVIGPELEVSTFRPSQPSRYPRSILAIVVMLCVIVLVAAFVPSAYRLYTAGETTFCQSSEGYSPAQCRNVGIATVLLAETGQLVFFFALAVLGESKRARTIFWASILLSTSIALVGNLHVGRPWGHPGIVFGFIETIAPPILVMAIGYVLKDLVLMSIERQHSLTIEFARAVERRQSLFEDPEQAGDAWLKAFSLSLRDGIRRAHSRYRDDLENLTADEWRFLIKREMLSNNWKVDPSELTRVEKESLKEQWQLAAASEDPDEVRIKGLGREDVISQNADGSWSAQSGISGKLLGTSYKYRGHAENALRTHHRALQKRSLDT